MSDVKEETKLIKSEVAKRFRVKPRTIEMWVADGKFPKPEKPGYKTALWPLSAIVAHETALRAGKKPRY